jgi:hypothetical protein
MTTTPDWTPMTTRRPTNSDLPVWLYNGNGRHNCLVSRGHDLKDYVSDDCSWTHWQPITLPAPPPRELTQREKDEAAALSALPYMPGIVSLHRQSGFAHGWHAALAYRDSENAKDLALVEGIVPFYGGRDAEIVEAVTRLRQRAGMKV